MDFGYVITEYEKVRQNCPEFAATMAALRDTMIMKAEADWKPLKFAGNARYKPGFAALGVRPGPGLIVNSGTFGESTIIPSLFEDVANATFTTWDHWLGYPGEGLTIPGNNTIMQGANATAIYEDYKVGVAGLAFLDKAIRISEVRMQISDKKIGRINIEEAKVYEKPAVIFEEGFILDEETNFHLYAYVNTPGPMRMKLIGLQLNRVYDKMLGNTGAALT